MCQVTRTELLQHEMGVPVGGGRQPPLPPSLLGKQSQSGNIHFTVCEYWLIIKINGTNSVNFVGNSVNFVGNMLIGIFRNHSFSPPPPPVDNNFGKFLRKILTISVNLGTIRKSRANFFPPGPLNFFFPYAHAS